MLKLKFQTNSIIGEAESPCVPRVGDVVYFYCNGPCEEVHHVVEAVLWRFSPDNMLDHVLVMVDFDR